MDAVASELRGMDAAYERCVKKVVIYSDKKIFGVAFSLVTFFWPLKRKLHADRAENQVTIIH